MFYFRIPVREKQSLFLFQRYFDARIRPSLRAGASILHGDERGDTDENMEMADEVEAMLRKSLDRDLPIRRVALSKTLACSLGKRL